jgi:23S rRNA (adenine2030-N6)-methyltransferase
MLSYRHAFHAGNFADVHKHVVLSLLLQELGRKDTPYCYLDTHAGAGRYDLQAAEARRNAEHRGGIDRLWRRDDLPAALRPYLDAVWAINPATADAAPRWYPGSPRLARHFLRPEDRMVLTELHPEDSERLRREFAGDRQVAVHHLDGYQGLKAFVPPAERRGLLLMDPPFERRDEVRRLIAGLETAKARWGHGLYALWFPLTHRTALEDFYRRLEKTGIRKILASELCVRPPQSARLNGSVMVVINPPWQFERRLEECLPWLCRILEEENGSQRCGWLVPE